MSIKSEIKELEDSEGQEKNVFMSKLKTALTFFILFMITFIIQSKHPLGELGLMLQQVPGIFLGIFVTLIGSAWTEFKHSKKEKNNEQF